MPSVYGRSSSALPASWRTQGNPIRQSSGREVVDLEGMEYLRGGRRGELRDRNSREQYYWDR